MVGSGGRGRASIGDVARLAGVSPATVSRVSMRTDNVKPATRQKVLAAMDVLGYAPNHAARALRYGNFGTIGVIAHHLSLTGESLTVEAVVEAARREGFTVSLLDIENPSSEGVDQAVQHLNHQSIDGLIIIRAETVTPTSLSLPPRLPVMVSDSRFVGHHPTVGADQTAGSRDAVNHLLQLGHRTVHHVAGPRNSGPAALRRDAWEADIRAAGREVPPVFQGDWTPGSGYAAGLRVGDDPEVTAVFCANDEMAVGVMQALHDRGVGVPNEVSVVGFDDIPLAGFLTPRLTTVHQDFITIGARLFELLLRQIRGDDVPSHHLVPAPLVVRASTAPRATRSR